MDAPPASGDWRRQPIVWLGALIFVGSLAGCVLTIVLAARHADAPLPTADGALMQMPLARVPVAHEAAPPASR